MNFTLTLNKINESDFNKVGYKALDLSKAAQERIEVPPCFVIPNLFFDVFLTNSGLDIRIQNILRKTNPEDEEDLKESVGKMRGLFKNAKIPNEYLEQLKEAYEALAVSTSFSSAQDFLVEENIRVNIQISPNYLTDPESTKGVFLNIKGFDDFCDAVKSAWMSLFSSSEIIYRYKHNIKKFNSGIIVEKMTTLPLMGEVYTKGSFANYDLFIKGYKGLPDITKQIAKDEYSVAIESLNINGIVARRQEFALLPSEKSTIIIKRSLGSRGDGQKLSNVQILEIARLSKKIKSVINKELKITFGLHNSGSCCLSINRLEKPSLENQENIENENKPVPEVRKEEIQQSKEENLEVVEQKTQDIEQPIIQPTSSTEFREIEIQETDEEAQNEQNPLNEMIQDDKDTSIELAAPLETKNEEFTDIDFQIKEDAQTTQYVQENEDYVRNEATTQEIKEEIRESNQNTNSNIFAENGLDDLENEKPENTFEETISEKPQVEIYESTHQDTSSYSSNKDEFILGDMLEDSSNETTQEQQIQESQSSEKGKEHYLEIIREHEPNLNEKIFVVYRQKYGDEPLTVEDAIARLSENAELIGLEAIQVLKSIKEKLISGEFPHLSNFDEIIREAKRFPGV